MSLALTAAVAHAGAALDLPGVAVAVHGAAADAQGAFIKERLAGRYRIVDPSEAALFIDVTADGDSVVVEVRDALGTLSRQAVSTEEGQRDVLVWLVVRSALERASEPGAEPPAPVVAPRSPPAVEAARAPPASASASASASVVPAFALAGALSSGDDLALEGGPRLAATVTLFDRVDVGVDAGYRQQSAGPVTLHAVPLAFSAGARFPLGASSLGALALSAGGRAELAPKWVQDHDVTTLEWSAGPVVALRVPLADLPLSLAVDAGVAVKLRRQGYVVDGVLHKESPWRAFAVVGVEWRWE